jgi:hypothetical protein
MRKNIPMIKYNKYHQELLQLTGNDSTIAAAAAAFFLLLN